MTVLSTSSMSTVTAASPLASGATPPPMPTRNDDPSTLRAALRDLQTKQMSALRLYQEEKALRQQETQRATALTNQLNALRSGNRLTSAALRAANPQSSYNDTTAPNSTIDNNSINISNVAHQYPSNNVVPLSSHTSNGQPSSQRLPNRVIQTEHFPADLRSIEVDNDLPGPSLTWYSPVMSKLMPQGPRLIATLYPLNPNEYSHQPQQSQQQPQQYQHDHQLQQSSPQQEHQSHQYQQNHQPYFTEAAPHPAPTSPMKRQYTSTASAQLIPPRQVQQPAPPQHEQLPLDRQKSVTPPLENAGRPRSTASSSAASTDVADHESSISERDDSPSMTLLRERLERAEASAAEARRSAADSHRLIADLTSQLDASTAACKDLLDTVKEQEDMIASLT